MKRRRVKITGIGPVTPAGIGREEFWKGILEPVSRVRPYRGLGVEHGPIVAAYLDHFNIDRYVPRGSVPKGSARHTLFAIAAAVLAIKDAGISKEELERSSCAIVIGSTLPDFGGIGKSIEAVEARGSRGANPRVVFTTHNATVPGTIGEILGITADSMTLQSSCPSGLDAVGYACELVGSGQTDIALCGGTDAPLHRFPLLEFRAAGLTPETEDMSARIARPFDMWRTTGVISEGACLFVIEPESSSRRGYSMITGYAFANDSNGDLCGGLESSTRRAMADAGVRVASVDAISAWGPGHRLIDAGEARAMKRIFSTALSEVPSFSIKGAIGSPMGAAGPIQIAATALGQSSGIIPPTVNWEYPDPECPLNLARSARVVQHSTTLINAHGLAGVNSSMILERC
jgi:3-oxoacyl-(acyl-carrier-protein) synthase